MYYISTDFDFAGDHVFGTAHLWQMLVIAWPTRLRVEHQATCDASKLHTTNQYLILMVQLATCAPGEIFRRLGAVVEVRTPLLDAAIRVGRPPPAHEWLHKELSHPHFFEDKYPCLTALTKFIDRI